MRCLGPRRTTLLLLGMLTASMAVIVSTEGPIDPGDSIAYELFPLWSRVLMWATCGAAAIVCALRRSPGAPADGYGWVMVMPAERGVTLIASQVYSLLDEDGLGRYAVVSGLVWTLLVLVVWSLARWPDLAAREDA